MINTYKPLSVTKGAKLGYYSIKQYKNEHYKSLFFFKWEDEFEILKNLLLIWKTNEELFIPKFILNSVDNKLPDHNDHLWLNCLIILNLHLIMDN